MEWSERQRWIAGNRLSLKLLIEHPIGHENVIPSLFDPIRFFTKGRSPSWSMRLAMLHDYLFYGPRASSSLVAWVFEEPWESLRICKDECQPNTNVEFTRRYVMSSCKKCPLFFWQPKFDLWRPVDDIWSTKGDFSIEKVWAWQICQVYQIIACFSKNNNKKEGRCDQELLRDRSCKVLN